MTANLVVTSRQLMVQIALRSDRASYDCSFDCTNSKSAKRVDGQ